MEYRVYIEELKGYENKGTFNIDDLFFLLDELILKSEKFNKILIIQHDISQNMDSPFYSFRGNRLEYLAFKQVISESNEKLKLKLN